MSPHIATPVPSQFSIRPNGAAKPENGNSAKSPNKSQPAAALSYQKSTAIVHSLSVLSASEQKAFAECEAEIAKGWQTFVDVGLALARVRDQKLYRAQHDTFEAYCREKWQYAKSHAYRLIGAAEVVVCLSPIGDIQVPTHEGQVRPLIGLGPEKAREAWRKAVEKANGAFVTANMVRNAVAEAAETVLPKPTKARPPEGVTGDRQLAKALDLVKQIENSLARKEEVKGVLSLLTRLKHCLKELKNYSAKL